MEPISDVVGGAPFSFLQNNRIQKKRGRSVGYKNHDWLVVLTHLKNISQIRSFPQVGVKK